MALQIVSHPNAPSDAYHDFEANRSQTGTELVVPRDVAEVLESLRITTAEEFVSYLRTFPTTFVSRLGWNDQDVAHALGKLVEILDGVIPSEVLNPFPSPKVFFGVVEPKTDRFGMDD